MTTPDPSQRLKDKIAAAKRQHLQPEKAQRQAESAGSVSAGALALRYGAEFGACVFVGIILGLGLDHLFNSRPWGLLIMLMFGLMAGILGVIRAYRELTAATNPVLSPDKTDPQAEDMTS